MFQLRKWYFDAVSSEGRAAIAYAAWLRMGPLRWEYSALVHRDERAPLLSPITTSRFGHAREPEVIPDGWRWSSPALGVDGRWHAIQRGPRITLHPGVEWTCHAPHATVEIRAGGETWQGSGYVECIEMSVPPWRLPIDELRWGRWIGGSSSLVWIDWQGITPQRWVVLDGRHIGGASIEDAHVAGNGWQLSLSREATLREGTLGGSVLAAAPCLRRLAPSRMVDTEECKWLSRGVLSSSQARITGWAVHERVTFDRSRVLPSHQASCSMPREAQA